MTAEKVDLFFLNNKQMFPEEKIVYMREKMLAMDEGRYELVNSIQLKNPTTVLIISILFGVAGIDRFLIGDFGLGFLKLITLGGLGVWAIVDIFLTYKKAREQNFAKIMTMI